MSIGTRAISSLYRYTKLVFTKDSSWLIPRGLMLNKFGFCGRQRYVDILMMSTNNAPTPTRNFYRRPLPNTCIAFSSDQGKELFKESLLAGNLVCYFKLASQFRTQDEPAFCGLSTLVMILNALEIDPGLIWKGPWRWYHENMLDCCTPLQIVEQNGINFHQFICIASCNNLNVISTRVDENVHITQFRETVKHYTQQDESFLVASYSRAVLGQTGDGHFSPIGAYNPERDMLLLLDTARFKYPPHWIPLELFFSAMKACDKETGQPRGYMILSKQKERSPMVLIRVSDILSVTLPTSLPNDLNQFLQSWKLALRSPTNHVSCIDEEGLLKTVLTHLIKSVEVLQAEHNLLSLLQLDNENSFIVCKMIKEMESLTIFSFLSNSISSSDRESLLKLFSFPSNIEDYGNLANKKLEYMLSFLILAWPYSCALCLDTSARCLAGEMIKYVNQVLAKNVEHVKNEVMFLNSQLDTIINFNEDRNKSKKCCQKSCNKSSERLY